ncbi:MAG TPA: HEAT repeat domain-containing protein [Gemmataceae bacterium]|jgi:HEAT repeat protein
MLYHRPVGIAAGLCLAALGGWAGLIALAPPEPGVAEWLAALKSGDVASRRRAVEALLRCGGGPADQVCGPLAAALGDPDLIVRGGAAAALVAVGPPAAGPVAQALRSGDVRARRGAVDVLARIDPAAETAGPLAGALCDEDEYVRRGAGPALGRVGSAAVPALRAALRDHRPEVRRVAADGLAVAGPAALPAVDDLAATLADVDADAGWAAAEALARVGPASLPALGAALRGSDPMVRSRAATALGRLGPAARSELTDLLGLARDAAADVRRAVAEAVAGIDRQPTTVAAVRGLLADADAGVRRAAAEALGHFGQPARAVARDLVRAQDDPDPDVGRAATQALLTLIGEDAAGRSRMPQPAWLVP